VTDHGLWRRLVVHRDGFFAFQRMDDTFVMFFSKVGSGGETILLSSEPNLAIPASSSSPEESFVDGRLAFVRPSADRAVIEGAILGRRVRMELRYVEIGDFRLAQGHFHWVQNYPVNR
jgi:hypothetical protein